MGVDVRSGVDDAGAGVSRGAPARTSTTFRWGVLGVLVALVLGALATLGYLVLDRDGNPFSGSNQTQAERDDVMSQARQFMLRVNTYGPDLLEGQQMPRYRELVTEVVTAKFAADFEENVPFAEATVAQAGVARTTEVFAVGVSSLDEAAGKATALVAGSFTNSFPDQADTTKRVTAEPQPYRVEVTLVRQDGKWLVDGFTPVGAEEQPQAPAPGDPTALPSGSPAPTEGATP